MKILRLSGFPVVLRALWVLAALFLLFTGVNAQFEPPPPVGHPAEAFMLSYGGMLILGAPASAIVIYLEQLLREGAVITTDTPMAIQWLMLWSLLCVIGFLQWFVLVPTLFRLALWSRHSH